MSNPRDPAVPSEISKMLQEFQRSFEEYGVAHLADKALDIMKEQHFEHKHFVIPPAYFVIESNTKKKWNQQVFKNNYYAWLKKFADCLNKVDLKKYPWISKKEILEPFLRIQWDQVKVFSFFERAKLVI
jgi:hypothetical protein